MGRTRAAAGVPAQARGAGPGHRRTAPALRGAFPRIGGIAATADTPARVLRAVRGAASRIGPIIRDPRPTARMVRNGGTAHVRTTGRDPTAIRSLMGSRSRMQGRSRITIVPAMEGPRGAGPTERTNAATGTESRTDPARVGTTAARRIHPVRIAATTANRMHRIRAGATGVRRMVRRVPAADAGSTASRVPARGGRSIATRNAPTPARTLEGPIARSVLPSAIPVQARLRVVRI